MAKRSNAECVRKLYAAIQNKDVEELRRVAGNARWTNVPFGDDTTIVEDMRQNFAAFPDVKVEIRTLLEQGDQVVVEGVARGTHRGALQTPQGEIPPTGKRMELSFLEIYEMQNGEIQSGRMYFDALGFFRQLGLGERRGAKEGLPAH